MASGENLFKHLTVAQAILKDSEMLKNRIRYWKARQVFQGGHCGGQKAGEHWREMLPRAPLLEEQGLASKGGRHLLLSWKQVQAAQRWPCPETAQPPPPGRRAACTSSSSACRGLREAPRSKTPARELKKQSTNFILLLYKGTSLFFPTFLTKYNSISMNTKN